MPRIISREVSNYEGFRKRMNERWHPVLEDEKYLQSLKNCRFIAIHGPTGSGKTRLSNELKIIIGGTHINVDRIPSPSNPARMANKYLEQVDFEILRTKIETSSHPIIIDCFVALDIFEILKIQPDKTILCRRINDEKSVFDSRDAENEDIYKEYKRRRNFN